MNSDPEQIAELKRQCSLVLELADEEVHTRFQCAKDGYAGDRAPEEARQLEVDVESVRGLVIAIPNMVLLLGRAVSDWPQFQDDSDGDWRCRVPLRRLDPDPSAYLGGDEGSG